MTNIISSDNSIQVIKLSGCDYDIKVPPSTSTPVGIATQNSGSVILAGLGTSAAKLIADVKVSSNPSNRLQLDATGLLVLPENVANSDEFVKVASNDSTSGYLFNKIEVGENLQISITGNTNKKLKIDFTGTLTPDVTVADSSSVALTGNGVLGNPVIASAKIADIADNRLTLVGSGLYVPPSDVSVSDTPTVDLDKVNNNITAVVKVSATENNRLTIKADGLFVSETLGEEDNKVKVNGLGSADFLENKIVAGIDPKGVVSLTFEVIDDVIVVMPSIDINALCLKLKQAGCVCNSPSELTTNIS